MAHRTFTTTHTQYFCDCCGYPESSFPYDPTSPFHIGHGNFSVDRRDDFDSNPLIQIIPPPHRLLLSDFDLCDICYQQAFAYLKDHPDADIGEFLSSRYLSFHPHSSNSKK